MVLLLQNYIDGAVLCLNFFNKYLHTYKARYIYRLAFYTFIHLLCLLNESYVCNLYVFIFISTPFIQNEILDFVQAWDLHIDYISTACNILELFSKYYISVKFVKYLRQICNLKLDNSNIFIFINFLTKSTIKKCFQKYCFFWGMNVLKKYNHTCFQSLRYILFIETEFWLEDLENEKAEFIIKTLVENKKWTNITDFQFMQSIFTISFDTLYHKMSALCVYMYFSYCTVNIMSLSIQYITVFDIIIYEYTINNMIEYPYNTLREQNGIKLYIKCVILYHMLFYFNIVFTITFYVLHIILPDILLELIFFTTNYKDIKKSTFYYKNLTPNP